MSLIRCVVVDDEPLARECLVNYIDQIDFLELVGIAENPIILSKLMKNEQIDLLFLDIQMPVMTGIDYLKTISNRPMVVLTTAYPNYALEGFELDVLDYLLKPVTFNRFFKAVSKASDFHQVQRSPSSEVSDREQALPYFFVRCDQVYEKIYFDEVLFVEGQENYVMIHTKERKYMVLMTMSSVETLLGTDFLRVHKSYIVSLKHISSLEKDRLMIDTYQIPISRGSRTSVQERILGDKLWRK